MRNAEDLKPSCWGHQDRLHIGYCTNLGNTLFNTTGGAIRVSDYAFFGHNCMVLAGTHDTLLRNAYRQQYPSIGCDIYIGEGVWVGSGAIILGPCHIEAHAVIGAGSVVLPGKYAGEQLWAGNPAVLKGML